ncbi:hypothetical protein NG54_01320 [Heyndrickxia ginsengihumi]|uniref:Uncharacterized protein n=1 Tax=Heyndrickxia ginsengihumi TaxID=363870 RepID=A0A0A6VGM4_9BACI|nr:hypothetical protein NG54_01320 [Heyndrickxia ginsengihumi]
MSLNKDKLIGKDKHLVIPGWNQQGVFFSLSSDIIIYDLKEILQISTSYLSFVEDVNDKVSNSNYCVKALYILI